MTKPSDCTCGFPDVMARNPSGHLLSCPAYGRWVAEAEARGRSLGLFAPRPASDPERGSPSAACDCATKADGDPADMRNWGRPASGVVSLSGHYRGCPADSAIMADYDPDPPAALIPENPVHVPMEDRGTPVWIWSSVHYVMFQPFDDAARRIEVSVPIGWELRPDSDRGVVLRSVFGKVFTAWNTLEMAVNGAEGFRVRSEQRIGAAHVGV